MDYGEPRNEQEMLKSIVSMLLGLAALAALLCLLPLSLRTLLLPPLRHAEAVTRAFAAEQAGSALALPEASIHGDDRAETLHLARCLRALASIISFFSTLPDFAGHPPFRGRPGRRLAHHAPATTRRHYTNARRVTASCAASRIDTS